ncbi:MAG: inositol monophosphatase family protein [Chthonomonadales bacterium]
MTAADRLNVEEITRLVVEAGRRARQRWGDVTPSLKADESYVTDVDLSTERFLAEHAEKLLPGSTFLGEEYGMQREGAALVWACDPIDGTTNFVWGLPHWGVSLGLLENGVPVLGVIYLPVLEDLFWAVRGKGAYRNGHRLPPVPDRSAVHLEDTLCLTSNALKTLNTEAVSGRLRCLGSIATELAYTACGSLCGTVGLHEGIVDMAAAFCIGAEVGCIFEYLDGSPGDIPELIRMRRTDRHFAFGPPNLVKLLQNTLHVR